MAPSSGSATRAACSATSSSACACSTRPAARSGSTRRTRWRSPIACSPTTAQTRRPAGASARPRRWRCSGSTLSTRRSSTRSSTACSVRRGAAGAGAPAGPQSRGGVAAPRWEGSTPSPLRSYDLIPGVTAGEAGMNAWVRVSAMVAAVAATVLVATSPAWGADVGLRVLSNRADLVSGDDALVEVTAPAGTSGGDLTLDVDGRDVTSAFDAKDGRRLVGLVTGLRLGANVLTARAPDGSTSRLTITDNPVGGPIIAGEQTQPWLCTTEDNGLGKATDAQCDAPSKVEYFYKSTGGGSLQSYDPADPPSDVAQTKTHQGKTLPHIVPPQRGAPDPRVYDIPGLFDPQKPLTGP